MIYLEKTSYILLETNSGIVHIIISGKKKTSTGNHGSITVHR